MELHRHNQSVDMQSFIGFLLMGLVVPISACSKANTPSRATYETCLEASKKANAKLPARQDSLTTTTGTSCRREGDRIVFVYGIQIDMKKSDIAADFEREQQLAIKNMICSNPTYKPLIQFADMRYDYYDLSHSFVGTVITKVEDCAFN